MDRLSWWMTRFSRLNSVALEECAARIGRTASEVAVLTSLELAGPVLNPSRLQGMMVQSPGGLTKTLRRLEEAGLVRRRTDPADRRALLVVLTPKGRRVARVAIADSDARYDDLLADLGARERAQLRTLLRRVLDRLEDSMDMPSTDRAPAEG